MCSYHRLRVNTIAGVCATLLLLANASWAGDDPGASEIKIGNTAPYSGPASLYSLQVKTIDAYFKKVNAEGGINGRKIKFISYDDAYSLPKTVEQTRRLVESDDVLIIFQTLGTAPNSAIQKYLNGRKIPQLFASTISSKFGDPAQFPWTMGWQPTGASEGRVFAHYILKEKPSAKIAVLYQNDDFGKEYLAGLKEGLGEDASRMIVAEKSYETSQPTVESEIVSLRSSGADVLVNASISKFAAQAIRKTAELGWHPLHILTSVSSSVSGVLKPAGLENAKDVVSAFYLKDPTDPQWQDDPGYKEWAAFMDRYFPEGDKASSLTVFGYAVAQTMVQVLKQCGDDLSRANIMKQAASLNNVTLPMLLPGVAINTSATDFFPIQQMRLARFDGDHWELFGPILP
jgi:ABC-type branched-subunit amino acid transport system substrate-binding protein